MSVSFLEAVVRRSLDATHSKHFDQSLTSAADQIGHDEITHVLAKLPVPERLCAMKISRSWSVAGKDAASWTTCELCEPRALCFLLPIEDIIENAIRRCGPALTRFTLRSRWAVGQMLEPLVACTGLQELDVRCCQHIDATDILDCLPARPFVLQHLKVTYTRDRALLSLSERCGHVTCFCSCCRLGFDLNECRRSRLGMFNQCSECDGECCEFGCLCNECNVGKCCNVVETCCDCEKTLCMDCDMANEDYCTTEYCGEEWDFTDVSPVEEGKHRCIQCRVNRAVESQRECDEDMYREVILPRMQEEAEYHDFW